VASEVGEVGAVLVIQVPERGFPQDPSGVRDLEEDGCFPIRDPAADELHEVSHVRDVLQGVAAADQVGAQAEVGLGVVVADERDPVRSFALRAVGDVRGIDADPSVRSHLAQEHEELPLAATDLEDLLVP
jgi:hypothetical protein